MKIIDILNKMANGTLENGFKFCLEDEVYIYTKGDNSIRDKYHNKIGQTKIIETYLNKEVLLFKDNNQEEIEEKKEIKELSKELINDNWEYWTLAFHEKINELAREVNKINKDLEKPQILNIEIDEETINNEIKKARDYLEREEK